MAGVAIGAGDESERAGVEAAVVVVVVVKTGVEEQENNDV